MKFTDSNGVTTEWLDADEKTVTLGMLFPESDLADSHRHQVCSELTPAEAMALSNKLREWAMPLLRIEVAQEIVASSEDYISEFQEFSGREL